MARKKKDEVIDCTNQDTSVEVKFNLFSTGLQKSYKDPIYKDPDTLANKIEEYFTWIDTTNNKPTITGLTLYMGYSSRQSLYDASKRWATENPLLAYIIKRATTLIENHYESGLHGNTRLGGSIFALKNMGWYDTPQVQINALETRLPAVTPELAQSIIKSIKEEL